MNAKKLTTPILITAVGLLLTVWGLHAGASQAAPSLPPATPAPQLQGDTFFFDPSSPRDLPVRRVQTLTLMPLAPLPEGMSLLDQVVSDTWPVRVDEVFYNRPYGQITTLPADAYDISVGVFTGTYSISGTIITIPEYQEWLTFTYGSRLLAVRSRDTITVTTPTVFTSQDPYPVTSTVVFTRQLPVLPGPEPRYDYWGNTYMSFSGTVPAATAQSAQEGWVQWVTVTKSFDGKVVLREPLFGSDLTITHFYMSPLTPTFGDTAHFTAVIKNTGVVTAWRWFATELYLRPVTAPPPRGPTDHEWGWYKYGFGALFEGWEARPLGPGGVITISAKIKIDLPGNFRAYAQVDTAYTDPGHYSELYGSNPEGYGVPPFAEENNVVASQPITISGSTTFLPVIMRQ